MENTYSLKTLSICPMMPTTEAILDALRPVQDPELQKSLVELNMIRNVSIDDSQVSFTLVLTTPSCPLKEFYR